MRSAEREQDGERREESALKNADFLSNLMLLLLSATVTFWGTFFLTLIVINALHVYGLDLSVPAIFSALISALVSIYIVKED